MTKVTAKPENLAQLVFYVRGEKVMLDADLAMLYGVETGALNRAVRRNTSRFPVDFMFQLTDGEWENLKCQIGISSSASAASDRDIRSQTVTGSKGRNSKPSQSKMSSGTGESLRSQFVTSSSHGGRRGLPYAFTEQGIAMLSSVLRSQRAIEVNIAIMRTFVPVAPPDGLEPQSRAQDRGHGKEIR